MGDRVGDYVIRQVLGAGGMGVVYEAVSPRGTRVAVKVLDLEKHGDAHAVRRFHDEAVAGLIVRHPNLASTIARGKTANGLHYIVMEHLCGESLGVLLQRAGPLSLRRAVGITRQILAGLDALHGAGIVHGDVKADNVLVQRVRGADRVRVIDFGLARVELDPALHQPPREGEPVSGTPEYMAPEVLRGEGTTVLSDVYATGVILYELITGTAPFAGTPSEIARCHLVDPVVPPSLRRPEIPTSLERVVLRALHKEPLARFATARDFAARLVVLASALDDRPGKRTDREAREAPTLPWIPRDAGAR